MKRVVSLIIVATLFAVVLRADDTPAPRAKKGPEPMQLTAADNGKTVVVAVGKAFDVVLKGNASTGFQWQLDKIGGTAVQQVGKVDYVLDKNPKRMAGVGGRFVFHFKVTKAAKTNVRLAYYRPWEKGAAAAHTAHTFDVTVDSTPQPKPSEKPLEGSETPKSTY
jgi:predicted secreted protein